jgi:putative transposase
MRRDLLATNEYYHICGRGNKKQVLFRDENDWVRFLLLLFLQQGTTPFKNISRLIKKFKTTSKLPVSLSDLQAIEVEREIDLLGFCLMPNHYHLLIYNKTDSGLSTYMQRVLTAYARYFNTKYDEKGHVFDGPFRLRHIDSEEYLFYVSAYIHKNPRELSEWRDHLESYPWSSLTDYVHHNRFSPLLDLSMITSHFDNYFDYVLTCPAKDLDI